MFGNNDDQQVNDNAAQAAMPDPITPDPAPAPSPVFGTPPANIGVSADLTTPEIPAEGSPDPTPEPVASDPVSTDGDLHGLKQQALQQLTPLVGHLEQTPEEKFRTTMMMIQASDDQTLIKSAFEAAQQITDDKARAQALLDVINEINYFTQQEQQND